MSVEHAVPEANPLPAGPDMQGMRFVIALTMSGVCTAAACANPIFIGPAVVLYAEALRQGRNSLMFTNQVPTP